MVLITGLLGLLILNHYDILNIVTRFTIISYGSLPGRTTRGLERGYDRDEHISPEVLLTIAKALHLQ
jgi:hypothetical protein